MNEVIIPEISIIVPVYKSENYLSKCIKSLIFQTFTKIEIILVNDGSPDSSGEICDSFARNDKRIKVIHKENGGATSALNEGTYSAIGNYIMYLDADDWIEPETCELALVAADKYEADVVFWSYVKEFKDKSVNEVPVFQESRLFEDENLLWLRRRMIGLLGPELENPTRTDALNSGWGKIYKRNLIIENQVLWTNTMEVGSSDVLFNIHVFKYIKRAVYIPKFLNHYSQNNPYSLTKNYKFTLFNKYLNLFSRIDAFIKENKLGEEFELALKNRVSMSVINNSLNITSPNFSASKKQRIEHLQVVLDSEIYKNSLSELRLSSLPFHWKLFFIFSKYRFASGVYSVALLMRKFRG